jgi:hypothetical protein
MNSSAVPPPAIAATWTSAANTISIDAMADMIPACRCNSVKRSQKGGPPEGRPLKEGESADRNQPRGMMTESMT